MEFYVGLLGSARLARISFLWEDSCSKEHPEHFCPCPSLLLLSWQLRCGCGTSAPPQRGVEPNDQKYRQRVSKLMREISSRKKTGSRNPHLLADYPYPFCTDSTLPVLIQTHSMLREMTSYISPPPPKKEKKKKPYAFPAMTFPTIPLYLELSFMENLLECDFAFCFCLFPATSQSRKLLISPDESLLSRWKELLSNVMQ